MTPGLASENPDAPDEPGPRILVVDDSATDRTLVTGLLSSERPEWQVDTCADATEGLRFLENHSATAVITDLVMPGMSGEQFLVEIRRRFPAVPVVLITAQGSDEIAARALALGAVNYVAKRRLSELLVPAIDEILRSHHEATMASQVLSHLVHSRTVFEVDSCLEQIGSLLHLIREHLHTLLSFADDEVRCVTDAVREALMNAHQYGSAHREAAGADGSSSLSSIRLEVQQDAHAVCFTVTDGGSGFDTSRRGASDASGIRFIERNVDEVCFEDGGKRICLTKRLSQPLSQSATD